LANLKGQPSIARPYFEDLRDLNDYEYLIDPVDLACQKIITCTIPILGYKIEAGFSVVVGVVVGYQGGDAQTVVDVVYEACSFFYNPRELVY
jgi:hypothetical protein